MPSVMLDATTKEGRAFRRGVTLLSGHYHQHREIARLVEEHGWDWVQSEVHETRRIEPPHLRQRGLFDHLATPPAA